MDRIPFGSLLLMLALLAPNASAAESLTLLHPLFANHAVLQRDTPLRIYGEATPGAKVMVELARRTGAAQAAADGHWEIELEAQPAGGPYTLKVRSDDGATQQAADILLGDVWLCAGQSNMVLQVHRSLDARAETAGSADARIRLLNIGETGSAVALSRFAAPVAWKIAGPQTVAEFSATCFYFARELIKSIDVPQGLVVAAWGGSRIQAWTSTEALAAHGGYDTELDVLRLWAKDPQQALTRWGRHWTGWWQAQSGGGDAEAPWQGDGAGWQAAPAALGAWERWGERTLADYNGMVWFRTEVALSADQAQQPATLALGQADEVDLSFVNGRAIGSSYGADVQRRYPVPRGLLRAGRNRIVVNVLDTYKDGGLTGPTAVRALELADGSRVPLNARWEWRAAPAGIAQPPRAPWHTAAGLSTLYNGMIAPIGAASLRGVLWYQGESNTFEGARYRALLDALSKDWRQRFRTPTLPWLTVQLANYGQAPGAPGDSGWAELREAQRQYSLGDPYSGMAVTIDIGDRYDIHPPNKQELGRRLARVARHLVHGEHTLPVSGPVPVAAWHHGAAVHLRLVGVTDGLRVLGGARPLAFELCSDAPRQCAWAEAKLLGADRIVLRAALPAPAARVRHAWADSPIVNVFDGAGLPVGPFELPLSEADPDAAE